ncbi:molybdopterin molybdotransferase MoeA [Cellulomonas bogoriensis]|uniref:Molybdopterin molybdenumtransferase n=1 Tax=Cellulomonas bogoriensis 69B4 = DSM 16987 TaxID=1386082 RepID=A0A0A0BSW3_9CELL|nr:gephyrin-like molybdotransferase Glp [Cellulomonas bogoriensis]KGM10727.1 molybdenum cofactor biosynthesis protein MoaA [Cellulomonas bogoriensis 69B4 = DSM 16987]
MRTVHDHLAAVLDAARPVPPLDVVLSDAAGCILAEQVTSPADVPRWSVAAVDGYAVRSGDVDGHGGARELPVVHDAPVTSTERLHLVPEAAILVAAGAPVPHGADCVVPMDRTDRGRARVVVRGAVAPGENVRGAGHDAHAGEVLLDQGVRVGARHLAVAAALGRGRLRVHPAPRVVVLSVGDELVVPGRRLPDGGIHDADTHALAAAVQDTGATAVRVGPVGDDRGVLREVIADQLVRADLLVVTGGLSAGPWDTVTDVLAPLGTMRFDQVAMTPGRRQGFGTVEGVPTFALPGHPVAAQVGYEVFVRPALRTMGGHSEVFRPSLRAAATHPWSAPAGVRQFVPGRVSGSPTEGYLVTALGDPGRPALRDLAAANCLAVVGEDVTTVRAGDTVPCLVLDS